MERSVCTRNCWISGAIAGVVVLLFTSGIGDLNWGAGVFLGIVTGVLFGAMMVWLACNATSELVTVHDGLTRTDWEREAVDREPDALLVSGPLGPEGISSTTQMTMVTGANHVAEIDADNRDKTKDAGNRDKTKDADNRDKNDAGTRDGAD